MIMLRGDRLASMLRAIAASTKHATISFGTAVTRRPDYEAVETALQPAPGQVDLADALMRV